MTLRDAIIQAVQQGKITQSVAIQWRDSLASTGISRLDEIADADVVSVTASGGSLIAQVSVPRVVSLRITRDAKSPTGWRIDTEIT